jgi:hypothetical protein
MKIIRINILIKAMMNRINQVIIIQMKENKLFTVQINFFV